MEWFSKIPLLGTNPFRSFIERFNSLRGSFARLSGMVPVKLLSERSRLCKPLRFPILSGITPDISFLLKDNACRLRHCPIDSGILLLSRLSERSMAMIFSSWPMVSVNAPESELCDRLRTELRLLSAKREAGMSP